MRRANLRPEFLDHGYCSIRARTRTTGACYRATQGPKGAGLRLLGFITDRDARCHGAGDDGKVEDAFARPYSVPRVQVLEPDFLPRPASPATGRGFRGRPSELEPLAAEWGLAPDARTGHPPSIGRRQGWRMRRPAADQTIPVRSHGQLLKHDVQLRVLHTPRERWRMFA